jgi:hypothetical protein
MKTYLKILLLFCCAVQIKAQCTVNVMSDVPTGCAPLSVNFNCPSINSGTGLWSIGNYTTVPGLAINAVIPYPGVYTVVFNLTITSTPTCVTTASLTITVLTGPANGCATTVAGLREFSPEDLLIAPNPNNGTFSIRLQNAIDNPEITIVNSFGQVVYEKTLVENHMVRFDPGKGVYFVKLAKDGRLLACKKLIVE